MCFYLQDLSLDYLAKAKILVIKDIEREDIEFLSKTLGCSPVASLDHFTADKLGKADLVEDEYVNIYLFYLLFYLFCFVCFVCFVLFVLFCYLLNFLKMNM